MINGSVFQPRQRIRKYRTEDERGSSSSSSSNSNSMEADELSPAITVKSLYIYPIKACRGISLKRAFISSTGLKWDRLWLVVNSKGRMLTQRVQPRLALVEVSLPEVALNELWAPLPLDSALELKAPGMELLQVPLVVSAHLHKVENASIWEWAGSVLDEGPDAAEWFTRYLGIPCKLVRFDIDNMIRPTDSDYARGFKITFSDGYPFLLASQASLDSLNQDLPFSLSINRFRPNIFVQGCKPFAEDFWETFTLSGLRFHGVKLCSRCKVTTINQETAEEGEEPLKTMQSVRAGKVMQLPKKDRVVFFGQNVVCEECLNVKPGGLPPSINVGDALTVLKEVSSMSELKV